MRSDTAHQITLCVHNPLGTMQQSTAQLLHQTILTCRRPKKRLYYAPSWETHELFAAPLLLWLPEQEVGTEDLTEKLVDREGPLSQAIESALR